MNKKNAKPRIRRISANTKRQRFAAIAVLLAACIVLNGALAFAGESDQEASDGLGNVQADATAADAVAAQQALAGNGAGVEAAPAIFSQPASTYTPHNQGNIAVYYFDKQDGIVVYTQQLQQGGLADASYPNAQGVLEPAGYFFNNEWIDAATGDVWDFNTAVSQDLALYPKLVAGYHVSFITGSGFWVDTQRVEAGQCATRPQDPERYGYTFGGWYATDTAAPGFNANSAPQFDFATAIAADAAIYAYWISEAVDYTIVYWLEKPNIPVNGSYNSQGMLIPTPTGDGAGGYLTQAQRADRSNFFLLSTQTKQAQAGSTVGAADMTAGVKADAVIRKRINDEMAPNRATAIADVWHDAFAAPVVVAGDGSTVLNVYVTREIVRLNFTFGSAPGDMTLKYKGTYDLPRNTTVSVYAKEGLEIASEIPWVREIVNGVENVLTTTAANKLPNYYGKWNAYSSRVDSYVWTAFNSLWHGSGISGYSAATRTYTFILGWADWVYKYHIVVYQLSSDQTTPAPELTTNGAPERIHLSQLTKTPGGVMTDFIGDGTQGAYFDLAADTLVLGGGACLANDDNFISHFGYKEFVASRNTFATNWSGITSGKVVQRPVNSTINSGYGYFFRANKRLSFNYDTLGGSPVASRAIYQGDSFAGYELSAAEMPTKANSLFDGWYTMNPSDPGFDPAMHAFDFSGTMPAQTQFTIFAKWITDAKTVRFYADAFAGSAVNSGSWANQTVSAGTAATEPAAPTAADFGKPAGFTFKGWYEKTSAGYRPYDFTKPVSGDLDIYAFWNAGDTASGYQVTYLPGEGQGSSIVEPYSYAPSAYAKLKVNTFTREGYNFTAWEDWDGNTYQPGSYVQMSNDLQLTALWQAQDFNVTYSYVGDVPLLAPALPFTQSASYGSSVSVAAQPELEGYTFSGWQADGIDFDNSGSVVAGPFAPAETASFQMPASDVELTGSFAPIYFTVRFIDHNGAVLRSESVRYGFDATAPADPFYAGHRFIGWSDAFTSVLSDLDILANYEVIIVVPDPEEPGTPGGGDPVVTIEPPVVVEEVPDADEPAVTGSYDGGNTSGGSGTDSGVSSNSGNGAGIAVGDGGAAGIFNAIANGNVPLGGLEATGVWSLASLLLALFALVSALATAILAAARSRRAKAASASDDEPNSKGARNILLATAAILAGALAPVLFIVLDDMLNPMVWINANTIWVAAAFALQMLCVGLYFGLRKRNARPHGRMIPLAA